HHIEPVAVRSLDQAALRVEVAICGNRKPETRWIGLQCFPVKFWRGHTDDRNGHTIELDRGTDHRRVPIEFLLPVAKTDHPNRWGRRGIVGRIDSTAHRRVHSEYIKIIAGHEPRGGRLSTARPRPAYANGRLGALESAEVFENILIPQ